jgi:hypothetical protein
MNTAKDFGMTPFQFRAYQQALNDKSPRPRCPAFEDPIAREAWRFGRSERRRMTRHWKRLIDRAQRSGPPVGPIPGRAFLGARINGVLVPFGDHDHPVVSAATKKAIAAGRTQAKVLRETK